MSASTNRAHNMLMHDIYGGADIPISELQVADDCKVCFRDRTTIVPEGEILLLSPSGVVHQTEEGDVTVCGRDATRHGWWHRV